MTTQLSIDKDPGAVPTYISPFSDETKTILLTADVAASIPVPSNANLAVMYYDTGKDVFVRANTNPILPTNATPLDTAGVLLKPSVEVTGLTTLNFICKESAFVCVEYYR